MKTICLDRNQQEFAERVWWRKQNVGCMGVAGFGKTTLIEHSVHGLRDRGVQGKEILCLSFMRSNRDQLEERLGQECHIKTIDGLCYVAVYKWLAGTKRHPEPDMPTMEDWGNYSRDDNKVERLVQDFAVEYWGLDGRAFTQSQWQTIEDMKKIPVMCMNTLTHPYDWPAIVAMCHHYGLLMPEDDDFTEQGVRYVFEKGQTRQKLKESWCYEELRYIAATTHDVRFWPYPIVFLDECLPYEMPVLLANGSSLPIGKIVEERLAVDVLAFDTRTGTQRPCRITNWQKLLNQKPLVKIRAKWTRKRGTNTPYNFVVCTTDHKVWCRPPGEEWHWVEAGRIEPGWSVQIETEAEKTQVGKITRRGRKSLSRCLQGNKRGKDAPQKGFPNRRGGNGTGLTLPQKVLMETLNRHLPGWQPELSIPTQQGRGSGYPNAYKVDIGHPCQKIAIEVDGSSHTSRRHLDAKKDQRLQDLGWRVFRIPNIDAVRNAEHWAEEICAQATEANCPIEAIVTEVEPTESLDYHVYDITVEDCHNFYANGFLVHNCQDTNRAHQTVLSRCVGDKLYFVGDPDQAIMVFNGADEKAFQTLCARPNTAMVDSPTTYRCPKAVVAYAQCWVERIRAAENALDGDVYHLKEHQLLENLQAGDVYQSRTNLGAISVALRCIEAGKESFVKGRSIGADMGGLQTTLEKDKAYRWEDTVNALHRWQKQQIGILFAKYKDVPPEHIDYIRDRAASLERLYMGALQEGVSDQYQFRQYIGGIFSDNPRREDVVLTTTGHKFKGDQNKAIFLSEKDLRPRLCQSEALTQAERNLVYVMLTRAEETLFIVEEDPLTKTS